MSRTRPPRRCAWCHGDLSDPFAECPGCKTVFHEDCGYEGCPTMGCSVRAMPLSVAPTRPGWSDFFFAVVGVFLIFETFKLFVFGSTPVPPVVVKDAGPFYVIMVLLQVVSSIWRVGAWAQARWRIRKARRSFLRRSLKG